MSKQTQYKPSEVLNILKDLIEANDKLMANKQLPVSVSIIGTHGIGKSTICKEVASDLGRGFFKLNLAQLTEPSELQGFYLKEFKLTKQEGDLVNEMWVTENLIPKFVGDGWSYSTIVRTTSCPPDWVINLEPNSILCLDDFSRGNSLFSQAVMELVNTNEMIGWDLKGKNIQIILNENPDNGEYNVSSSDAAQGDRMAKINMIWNAQDWAARAEKIGLDERLINFVLWAPELLEAKKSEGISASNNVSPRMMDKFFGLVSTIEDLESNLDKISTFGDMTVGKDVTSQLINFVNKKLDKLPSIDDLIKKYDVTTSKSQLTACCGDSEKDSTNWKSATAAILTTRMYNYMRYNQASITKDNIRQYLELVLHPSFSVDQKYLMVKQTISISNTFAMVTSGDPRFLKFMTK